MKRILSLLFMLAAQLSVTGQLNLSNYTDGINTFYTGVDTLYQLHNEIKTVQEETAYLNKLFPFQTNQVNGSAQSIQFFDTLQPQPQVDFPFYISWGNGSNYYKAQKLSFKVNQDTGYTFCYKNKAVNINPKTAYIIIPGSGINQATGVAIYNPANYHNAVCTIAQSCRQYGDVYTYARPNDDFAALWTTVSPGVRRKMGYTALTSKTNLINKNWAANCYIQINALVKYLKTKYNKVVVLGLSSGAWGAMFSSLQTEPDAALMASGYSISFHDLTYTYGPDQMHYDGLFSGHPIDSVRSKIRNMNTQFLFSYGTNDAVTHMEDEHDNHTTENYFNTPSAPGNTSYFYNYSLHRFPCEAIDTFFTRIEQMPKVTIEQSNTCNSDSLVMKLRFIGTPPYQGMLYRNNIPYQTFSSLQDSTTFIVYDEGDYQIKNLLDSNQVEGFKSNIFTFNKISKLIVGTAQQQYLCASDSTQITLPISGTAPYRVYLAHNNQTDTLWFNNNSQFNVVNGAYNIQQISDLNECIWDTGQSFNVSNQAINAVIDAPIYDCDSNKNKIIIHLNGNGPWQINYNKSGTPFSIFQTDTTNTYWFENGQYLFNEVSDNTGCYLYNNQYVNLSGTPIQSSISSPLYNCDSNKIGIQINTQGNSPFNLFYLKNNSTQQENWQGNNHNLYLTNGAYQLAYIQDVTGCVDSFNTSYFFQYDSLDVYFDTPYYDCDSNKTALTIHTKGNGPWLISYAYNGQNEITTILDTTATWYLTNGQYLFQDIIDSTGCSKNINQVFNFQYQTLSWNITQQAFDCDSNLYKTHWAFTGNGPWTVQYSYNGGPILSKAFTSASSNWYLSNGQYQFINITDNTSCTQSINVPLTLNFNPISINTLSPIYDCDSNKTKINFALQGNGPWIINYTVNGLAQQMVFTQANTDVFFANGLYQFIDVVDSTGCMTSINQWFSFQYQALSWNITQQAFDCDSNLYKTQWAFTGNGPWTIQYSYNGGPILSKAFTSASSNWYLSNGQYQFINITDNTSCTQSINVPLTLNFNPISINTLSPIYDCDSNKTKINFALQGNGPWIINYTVNGLAQQMVFTQANTDVFFANGLYQFIDVVDSTGCMTSINQWFSFQYQALSWNITQQAFDCDSNLYKTQWAFTGNGPWTLTYELIGGFLYTKTFTNSNATLYLPNGQWQMLSVSDNTGCVQAINVPITVNYTPLSLVTSIPQYDCDSNKMQVSFSVQGNAPFVFQVNQLNNNNTQWLNTSQNNPSFWWGNGQYLIQQVTDATGCIKSINQYVNHTIQPLSYQALPKQYNCDSQKVRFPFTWQGNAPWIISYRNLNNGLVYTQIDSLASSSLWLASGQYALLSLSDAYCTIPLQDTLVVNFPNLNVQLTTPGILCDSNKTRMELTVQAGLAPMFLHYVYNGVPDSMSISAGQQTKLLPNGSYYFNQVRDSAQCAVVLNKSYTANYIPLQWYPWTNQYNCLSNINNISFNMAGANNTTLYYTRNGNPNTLLLNAGINNVQWNKAQYQLAYIRDTAQCSLVIDTTFTITDEPIAFEVSDLKPICEDKVHEYTFKVKGKAPWAIIYNYENATRTIYLNDTTNRWNCDPGKYDFVKITDANGCNLALTRIDTLQNFIQYNPILTTNYQTLQIEPENYPITWWFNQQAMDSTLYNGIEIRHRGEGSYYASLIDDAKCVWLSNIVDLEFDNPLTLYPNPTSDQIALLIQDNFGTNWRWQISNALGQDMASGQVAQPLEIINVKTWPSGIYSVLITYQNSPNRRIVRFVKK